MIKIFLALVSVVAVLTITLFVRILLLPVRRVRGLFKSKAIPV